MADLARILLYGDLHLSSKNYGAHRDYPKESLYYFQYIANKVEELQVTHAIGLGDFSFGRFSSLEYREGVDTVLERMNNYLEGRHYQDKGNHDFASYGMTEYDYYIKKGLLKPAQNFRIGNVNISMINNGEFDKTAILDPSNQNDINVVIAHDYFKFDDTRIADYGKAIRLEDMTNWFGVDYLFCGHIHNFEMFEGMLVKDNIGHRMIVTYLGCLARPAYRAEHMDETGHLVLLTIRDTGDMQFDLLDVPLWGLDESFNLEIKEAQQAAKEEKERRVDISDIVEQLNSHDRNVGNPEDIIDAMQGIDEKYKKKAIALLKAGQA